MYIFVNIVYLTDTFILKKYNNNNNSHPLPPTPTNFHPHQFTDDGIIFRKLLLIYFNSLCCFIYYFIRVFTKIVTRFLKDFIYKSYYADRYNLLQKCIERLSSKISIHHKKEYCARILKMLRNLVNATDDFLQTIPKTSMTGYSHPKSIGIFSYHLRLKYYYGPIHKIESLYLIKVDQVYRIKQSLHFQALKPYTC